MKHLPFLLIVLGSNSCIVANQISSQDLHFDSKSHAVYFRYYMTSQQKELFPQEEVFKAIHLSIKVDINNVIYRLYHINRMRPPIELINRLSTLLKTKSITKNFIEQLLNMDLFRHRAVISSLKLADKKGSIGPVLSLFEQFKEYHYVNDLHFSKEISILVYELIKHFAKKNNTCNVSSHELANTESIFLQIDQLSDELYAQSTGCDPTMKSNASKVLLIGMMLAALASFWLMNGL